MAETALVVRYSFTLTSPGAGFTLKFIDPFSFVPAKHAWLFVQGKKDFSVFNSQLVCWELLSGICDALPGDDIEL